MLVDGGGVDHDDDVCRWGRAASAGSVIWYESCVPSCTCTCT